MWHSRIVEVWNGRSRRGRGKRNRGTKRMRKEGRVEQSEGEGIEEKKKERRGKAKDRNE